MWICLHRAHFLQMERASCFALIIQAYFLLLAAVSAGVALCISLCADHMINTASLVAGVRMARLS